MKTVSFYSVILTTHEQNVGVIHCGLIASVFSLNVYQFSVTVSKPPSLIPVVIDRCRTFFYL